MKKNHFLPLSDKKLKENPGYWCLEGKFNPVLFKVDEFLRVINTSLDDSNMFLRSVFLSIDFFQNEFVNLRKSPNLRF